MPTYYFNITNPYVMKLVDEKNFNLLDQYLEADFDVEGRLDELNLYPVSTVGALLGPWVGPSDQYDEKLYDILSYAIPTRNVDVVKQYGDKLDIHKKFDGNAYTLAELIEKLDYNIFLDKEIIDVFYNTH